MLALLLGPAFAWARPTTEAEARRSVAGWLALDPRPLGARMGAKPLQIKAFRDRAGNLTYFVVSLEPGGFAVVAGDDLLEPIVAFAPQGNFDPSPQNPLYVLLNQDLSRRLAELREQEEQARARGRKFIPRGLHRRARSKWTLLQGTDMVSSTPGAGLGGVSDLRVEPLVQSRWGQDYEGTQLCYNYFTPYNYPAGCFATAIAQLLRYHSRPSGPVDGTQPFDIRVDLLPRTAFLRGGDGNGGPYDWDNMVLDPDANTPENQRQAIGALTHDTGVAVHTSYTYSGSGAYNQDVPSALTDTFGFGNARYAYNSIYTIPGANLNNMINPNLDARFPVLLGIIDPDLVGHEVVADGYGYNVSTLYHHLNLGWTGTADAWYNLPTISASIYNFTSVIECIYNIFPEGSGEIISGRVLDAAGNPVSDATITATRTGAFTPWISDGTPHTWFTPAGQTGPYLVGASHKNVPDMLDPGLGNQTFYYTNQQSGRFMFYHDHAVAITRLNVYAGLVAPYIIHDPVEDDLIDGTNNTGVNPGLQKIIPDNGGGVYKWGIPLIIQDKSFVPLDVLTLQDTRWNSDWGTYGDLWYPHIYEPNQSLTDPSGMNPYGRWDFGPWVQPNILSPYQPEAPMLKAALPLPGTDVNHPENYLTSTVPEAFMDTMMVNGTAYPYMNVQPKAYRFRILNGCNDRFLNLQLYLDASGGGTGATATATVDTTPGSPTFGQITSILVTNGGTGYNSAPGVIFTGGGGFGAWGKATISGPGGIVTGITITNPGSGYTSAPTVTIGATTEVSMVPAVPNGSYPASWPKDGRDGGVPDPFTAGPKFIQIGNEGGILPGVTVRDNQPVNYDYDRGSATFGNVQNLEGVNPAIKGVAVFLGPAERADVIVDFSSVAPGTNVILYNDAPAPVPGFQPRYDYYTGNPDLTDTGGAPQTQVGIGPNTRTIMQFRVTGTPAAAYDLAALQAALPNAYVLSQPPPIVPETYYPGAYHSPVDYQATINATSLTWQPIGATGMKTMQVKQKAITEIFEEYGRLSARLGYEVFDPTANPARSNGIGFGYIDPPAEVFYRGQVQIWKVTHNGVDTHPVHIHLNNAQIINRVGWDGVIKPPEPYERGWKETIRMNPLEVIYIAQKADLPNVPFVVPYSIRPLNPSRPLGDTTGFTNINPLTGQPINTTPTVNVLTNFGHEYVWHCHILAHEENDMMRPMKVTGIVPVGALDLLLLQEG